eukprot:scaffold27859_cov30-Phaeocystis_antarctica.AAC.1
MVAGARSYSADDPCPPTEQRLADHNAAMSAANSLTVGGPRHGERGGPRHGLSNTHTSRSKFVVSFLPEIYLYLSKRPSPEQRPARCWPAGAPARDRAPTAGRSRRP